MIRSMIFLKIKFLDINADFVRVLHFFMVEKMQLTRDKKEVCGTILTDLSKAFDCISHHLLIAKLNAYGIDHNALNFIHNYLYEDLKKLKWVLLLVISWIYCTVFPKVPY